MKVLFSIMALLTLVLMSCANVPASPPENTPTASMQASSENGVEIVGGDEESLRAFIREWMQPVSLENPSQGVTVYIGRTPKDVPYDLPAPEGSRVIGSITGNWVEYMLIYASSLSAESIQEFYAQSLIDKGWKEAPMNQGSGGFVSGTNSFLGYCYGEGEAFLTLETPSITEESTSVRLSLDTTPEPSVCNPDPNAGSLYIDLIPTLRAPKGVTTQGGSAGGSDRSAEVTAGLKGNLSAAELVDFYNEQLVATGWEMQNSSQGEGAAWSNWTFQDSEGTDWIGTLMVAEVSLEGNSLFAVVTIEKDE